MEFFDYLVSTYGYNEVILSNEISFNDYSVPWIKKALGELCKKEQIIRFEKGVYYIPTDTPLGKSNLDYKKVIKKKYINNGNDDIGYFSGVTFMNMIGLSTQMPNVFEIYTNNESSRIREVSVGTQRVILRRSRSKVTSRNAATMSFLELMNSTDANFYDDYRKKIVVEFIKKSGITKKTVSECLSCFPDKAIRTLIESEVIYDIT